jgi:hypothetical protein
MRHKREKANASIYHIELLTQEVLDLDKQLKNKEISQEEHDKKIERIEIEIHGIKRDIKKLQNLGEFG